MIFQELTVGVIVMNHDEFERVIISYDPGEQLWELQKSYTYLDRENSFEITIYKGSRYDLSSVPRPFWKVVSPFDLSNEAPLVHDFLYITRGGRDVDGSNQIKGKIEDLNKENRYYTREEVDLLFRQMMIEAEVKPWRIFLGYWAVNLVNTFTKWE